MNERTNSSFIGYEYKTITVRRGLANLYADCMPCFGWILEETGFSLTPGVVTMKFKRDRKTVNKAELTRLQREFESRTGEIIKLKASKIIGASTTAYIIGVLGTAFMAGSVFAITAATPSIPLCIVLAVPGFIGWVLPYFCYQRIRAKKAEQVLPLIDAQHDAIYEACEKASSLLYK